MAIPKNVARAAREAYLAGDIQSAALDSAGLLNPTTATVQLTMVAQKVTVQAGSGMSVTVTVSMNGIDFITGGTATNTAPFSYNTHNVKVVKLVAASGAGNVVILAV